MFIILLIFFAIYFITGIIKNILAIMDYIDRREEKLDNKYPYRKKLQE